MKTRELLLALALCLASACGGEGSPDPLPDSDVPERFFLETALQGAQAVGAIVASAKDGDEVVVIGRVGGAKKVFVDGYAAFTIVDAEVQPCGAAKMDECETPWDYCCDPPEVMTANSLSVELVLDGKPIKADARGFHGLDHLKTVVVAGKVARDAAGNVRVLATGLHVKM